MLKAARTYIFCYDDHRDYSEEIRKRFSDQKRYVVTVFHNAEDFINQLGAEKVHGFCKVAIVGVHDTSEDIGTADHLMSEIRKTDRSTVIIFLCPLEKIEEIKKGLSQNADAYIPLNTNQVLRIHNIVKKHISEHNLSIYRRRRNLSLYFLIIFLALGLVIGLIAFLKFPQYF